MIRSGLVQLYKRETVCLDFLKAVPLQHCTKFFVLAISFLHLVQRHHHCDGRTRPSLAESTIDAVGSLRNQRSFAFPHGVSHHYLNLSTAPSSNSSREQSRLPQTLSLRRGWSMRVKIFIVTFWSERHAYHRVHFPNENPTWRHNWICATRFDNGWDTTVSIEWAYHVTTSFLSSKNVRKHSLLYTGRSTPGLCWSALDTDRCC